MDAIVLKAVCAYAELFRYERMPFMTVYGFYNQWRTSWQLDPDSPNSHERALWLCTYSIKQRKKRIKNV